jgi:nucleoid-associated protein YgaU
VGRPKSASRAATGVVYDGEDLLSVAARELGDASRWHEIADLNGIRDPRAITRAQVIRLP